MPNVYADRVRETTITTGVGTYDLSGAVVGFQTFVAGVAAANTCFYCAEDGTDWEVGQGTVTDAAPDTLSRDTILASSNGDAAVNWGAGTKKIFAVMPAQEIRNPASMVIGTAGQAGDGTLHVHTASAGSIAANSNADDLVVENSAAGGISILTPNNVVARLVFGDPEDVLAGQISYDHASKRMNFNTEGGFRVSIDENGTLFVNDTANVNMTIGLHINQGGSDDEILALASSDVTHGATLETETNTFAFFKKIGDTTGGLLFEALREGAITSALQTVAVGGTTDDTDHDTSSVAPFLFDAYKTNGTGKVAVGANGNIFVVRNGTTAKFIVDAEGNLFSNAGITTTAVTVFDGEDDIALCRAFDLRRADRDGLSDQIVHQEWDDWANKHSDRLVDLCIIGADGPNGERGLVNVTQLQRLHNGAICQLHTANQKLLKRLEVTEQRLTSLSSLT